MTKPEIAIRADGNSNIGLGHIHRMLAFAGCLRNYYSIHFFCVSADELVIDLIEQNGFTHCAINKNDYTDPTVLLGMLTRGEIIVLDGYEFKTDYQAALMKAGHRVIAIDDLNEWENVANVVINHAYSGEASEYKVSKTTKFYSGLQYAIIKQEVLNAKTNTPKTNSDKILVCIGGTDPLNYSQKIVLELLNNTSKNISLLTYPLNPKFNELKQMATGNVGRLELYYSLNPKELIQLIRKNDMAILQPSNIALEAASVGIGIYLIQTAENQKYILETLIQNKCADKLDMENLSKQVNKTTIEDINRQILHQHQLVDGKSPQRIIEIVNELCLVYRQVKEEDVKLIYDWNNDDMTRANSYNQSKIEYKDHVNWFNLKLKEEALFFLIFYFGNEPAGCVRIDSKKGENIIGITIAPEMRGKRLAASILKLACENYFTNRGESGIIAYIKKSNTVSLKSFINAGFKVMDENQYFGELSYKLIKNSK